jgi:hypothetical protein
MIIYNVTIKILPSISKEWIAWMKAEHIPDLMNTGLFLGHQFCRLLEQDESDGITFSVQYFCKNQENYETYITHFSPAMREKGFQKFGDQFIAFRTVMETVD